MSSPQAISGPSSAPRGPDAALRKYWQHRVSLTTLHHPVFRTPRSRALLSCAARPTFGGLVGLSLFQNRARISMSLPRASLRLLSRRSPHVHARPLSTQPPPRTQAPSAHARFYTDYAAGMIPVALLGSAVYIVRSLLSFPYARAVRPFLHPTGLANVATTSRP